MAKKHTLDSGPSADYSLLGLVTQLKDYRLAYLINSDLAFHLKKYDDLQLTGKEASYSWYCHYEPDDDTSVFLFHNLHENGRLIPSQKMDYFMLFRNLTDDEDIDQFEIMHKNDELKFNK